ncbi:MAG: Dam family site-specific DNA-(adenine-N6)-methyltransferase [Flavobacteriales bacterium]|nr:Dam family site-specific DNA-(adenine-N6)-methyltransferase [Flavobacteriales bacterium]
MQLMMGTEVGLYAPPRTQLLKWIGNKQKFAREIANYFPSDFERFVEPFLGSGAIMATVAPDHGVGSDAFAPLIQIWTALSEQPRQLVQWYANRYNLIEQVGKEEAYAQVLRSYNENPNGADLLFLSRTCYGGVVRFRKRDGFMSTPCGAHAPITPKAFRARVEEWGDRMRNVQFIHRDYREAFADAREGDFIYCDPPYSHSQTILYGAQTFRLAELLQCIEEARSRGARVALSIDGNKKSGSVMCALDIPEGLFAREIFVNCGRSMLRRFQLEGSTLETELVADRLLLTY